VNTGTDNNTIKGNFEESFSSLIKVEQGSIVFQKLERSICYIKKTIPSNVYKGWFLNGDRNYKLHIVGMLEQDPQLVLSSQFLFYCMYLSLNPSLEMGFHEFLNTPVTLYRGGPVDPSDPFSSYSLDRKVSEKFAEKYGTPVQELKTVPKESYGLLNLSEKEVLIKNDCLKDRCYSKGDCFKDRRGLVWAVSSSNGNTVTMQSKGRPRPSRLKVELFLSLVKENRLMPV